MMASVRGSERTPLLSRGLTNIVKASDELANKLNMNMTMSFGRLGNHALLRSSLSFLEFIALAYPRMQGTTAVALVAGFRTGNMLRVFINLDEVNCVLFVTSLLRVLHRVTWWRKRALCAVSIFHKYFFATSSTASCFCSRALEARKHVAFFFAILAMCFGAFKTQIAQWSESATQDAWHPFVLGASFAKLVLGASSFLATAAFARFRSVKTRITIKSFTSNTAIGTMSHGLWRTLLSETNIAQFT
jgi:hypothetical protein